MGAVDMLFLFREEMQQWLEEAQEAPKHEALENVMEHLQAVENVYRYRRDQFQDEVSD